MEFKNLSNEKLLDSTKSAIECETKATTNVVRHFREIYDRDLHLLRGYPSMFLMAVNEFGYDKASAQRRVNAMELSFAVPSVLERIDRGEICLQSAADIQTFLNKERGSKRAFSDEEKVTLVESCVGLSTRETQIELAKRNPVLDFKESKKFVAKDRILVTHTMSIELEEKLERILRLRSHVNPYLSREELLDYMAEFVLERIDPLRKAQRKQKRERAVEVDLKLVPAQEPSLEFTEEIVSEAGEIQLVANFEESTRYIKADDADRVRLANAGRGCAYVDPLTGRRCGSHHQLQIDHVVEYSRGGSNRAENLRLLCAQHNRLSWRRGRVRESAREYVA